MAFKLFGMDIENVRQSMSWGNAETSLDVNLVKCDDTQTFTPADIGTPVSFTYGTTAQNLTYFGILDKYQRERSPEPRYSVNLTNGVHILNGVKLILRDYTGFTNDVDNLMNIYGSLGFASSQSGHNGIYWQAVRDRIVYLTEQSAGTNYGGPIMYNGHKYGIDLSELPAVPSDYIIQNPAISVMEFVEEICDLGGHEYFVELVDVTGTAYEGIGGYSGVFVIRTIDRTVPTNVSALSTFIDSQDCVVSDAVGQEIRRGTHAKFLLGANREDIYYNTPQNTSDTDYTDDTILPYFGKDANNDAIIGYALTGSDDYFFDIDVRDIDHPFIGATYTTSLAEIRAAKRGRGAWERFLSERNCNEYLIDTTVTEPNAGGSPHNWQPFQLIIKTTDLNDIINTKKAPIPSWMRTNYNDGTYEGIGILKFGYGALRSINLALAQAEYPNTPQYYGNTSGANIGDTRICYYVNTATKNPYFGIASKLNALTGWEFGYARLFEYDLILRKEAAPNGVYGNVWSNYISRLGMGGILQNALQQKMDAASTAKDIAADSLIEKTSQLYSTIRNLANSYYNRKFMVKVPEVVTKIDYQTDQYSYSLEPTQAGYIDESAWGTAAANGLIPNASGINKITTQENKFVPYVKYEDAFFVDPSGFILSKRYDLSEISENNKIMQTTNGFKIIKPSGVTFPDGSVVASGTYANIVDVWVKTSVQEDLVFSNDANKTGAYAVMELPGTAALPSEYDTLTVKGKKSLFTAMTWPAQHWSFNGASATPLDDAVAAAAKATDGPGNDDAIFADGEDITLADLYAVPLRSNTASYGPWYAQASGIDADTSNPYAINGEVEYEKNEQLAPWNYGGYTNLNLIANATVSSAISNQSYDSTGSIEFNGPPQYKIGDVFSSGSPYITDVNVSYDLNNGFTTTYSFQSWSDHRQLGSLNNFFRSRFSDQNKQIRKLQRSFREGLEANKWDNARQFSEARSRFMDLDKYLRRDQNNTSSKILIAESDGLGSNVAIQPTYNTEKQAFGDYKDKAITSLDGIFAPYSTYSNSGVGTYLPVMKYVDPVADGNDPTSANLNPWRSGNPVKVASFYDATSYDSMSHPQRDLFIPSTGIPSNGTIPARMVGLKAPLWMTGYGYDLNGNPVPYAPGSGGFHPDYLWDTSLHKTGPVDIRWDEDRGVWAAGGGGGTTTQIVETSCGCACSEGTDIDLQDGMPGTSIMRWVAPDNFEVPVSGGIIKLKQTWYLDTTPADGQGYPMEYVGFSGADIWRYSSSNQGNFEARLPDTIDGNGQVVTGAPASGWNAFVTATFRRTDLVDPDCMSLVVELSGVIIG